MKFFHLFIMIMASFISFSINAQENNSQTNSQSSNKVTVQDLANKPEVADRYIERTLQAKIANDKSLSGVKVSVKEGIVTVEGSINTQQQADDLTASIKTISGVTEVKNNLKIKESASNNQ